MAKGILLAALVLAGGLAGCAATDGDEGGGAPPAAFPRCEHPWPCADGSEWPVGLVGPFEPLPPERVLLESHDGVVLSGHVWRPEVPEGVKVPVVVHSAPYFAMMRDLAGGEVDGTGSTGASGWMDTYFGHFTKNGFALLLVNVRGTGESGGCFTWGGRDEQLDHARITDWAASQPWSNGRVGFWGISYMGTTPWEAALHAPEGLKAIWAGGIITDWYLNGYTPQGLAMRGYETFSVRRFVGLGVAPPLAGPSARWAEWAPHAAERVCPGTPDHLLRQAGTMYADDRKPEWFEERRMIARFDQVTAAVLVPHGLQDNSAHRFQEDVIWSALPHAPKWFLLGQWGHTIDFNEQLATYPHGQSDWDLTLAWFGFWLKGVGAPPRLDVVDYQVSDGTWRESAAWPPVEARNATLFLGADGLRGEPGEGAWSFRAIPAGAGTYGVEGLTPDAEAYGCGGPSTTGSALAFVTEPLPESVVAGNPYALLTLEADRPGGSFHVELLAFPGATPCEDPSAVVRVAHGGVDLRFHQGELVARDFPVGEPQEVRVDLWNVAHRVPEGTRLALLFTAPENQEGQPWSPTVTLRGGSHLVLPVVEGALGGGEPPVAPPPRPFAPAG